MQQQQPKAISRDQQLLRKIQSQGGRWLLVAQECRKHGFPDTNQLFSRPTIGLGTQPQPWI